MSQHDGVIADAAGLAFLADLNLFLPAILSNSSGASEPGTMYAYQWWADTTTGILKIRNAANSAWVSILTLATGLPLASGVAFLAVAQNWTAAQRGAVSALTDGATITPDFAVANNFSLTIGGNRTLANPTNLVAGQGGVITITQDGTGSRTLAFGSYWKFPSGSAPVLTTTAGAVDTLAYYVESGAVRITAKLTGDSR